MIKDKFEVTDLAPRKFYSYLHAWKCADRRVRLALDKDSTYVVEFPNTQRGLTISESAQRVVTASGGTIKRI